VARAPKRRELRRVGFRSSPPLKARLITGG
jgi:hypothetical protein